MPTIKDLTNEDLINQISSISNKDLIPIPRHLLDQLVIEIIRLRGLFKNSENGRRGAPKISDLVSKKGNILE